MKLANKFAHQYNRPLLLMRAIRSLGLTYPARLALFLYKFRRLPNFNATRYLNDFLIENDYRDPVYAFTSDKEFLKIYARGVCGRDICVPTLDVLRNDADIENLVVTQSCVAKPTHMSQQVLFLKSNPSDEEIQIMKNWLRINYADYSLEEFYGKLTPKIIIEPYVDFLDREPATDYKLFVHDGKVRVISVLYGSLGTKKVNYYAPDWSRLDISSLPSSELTNTYVERPRRLDDMIELAEALSARFKGVRVDMYTDGKDRVYVGELTHMPSGGTKRFVPVEAERYFVDGVPTDTSDEDSPRSSRRPNSAPETAKERFDHLHAARAGVRAN